MYAFFGDCTIFLESEKFTTEKEGHCLRFFALQSVSLDALGIALDMSESFQTKWQRFANYCKMKQKELLTSEFCKLFKRSLIFFFNNSNEIFIYSDRCFIANILLLHCTCT